MAKIRKRGKSYQIDYVDPNGRRVRKSFSKKKDAEAELGKRVSLIAENRYLDVKKDYKTTLKELLDKYEENFKHQPSWESWKRFCLENFKVYFGEDSLLSNTRYVTLETYRNHLKIKPTRQGNGIRTDSTINREMGVLRHILGKAVEWELMEQSPFDKGKSLQYREVNERSRYLTEDELERLLSECPEHLRRIVTCAVNTGMDRGEILNLKWSQVRDGFLYLGKYKTRPVRQIPINDDLDRIFKEIQRENDIISKDNRKIKRLNAVKKKVSDYVFTYGGRNIERVERAFKNALDKVGIEDFRFKDLRHTFASHVLMRGGTLKDIQELLGHKSMTMTMRYAHLSQEHKKKAVNLLNGLTAPTEKKPADFVMSQNVTKHKSLESAIG